MSTSKKKCKYSNCNKIQELSLKKKMKSLNCEETKKKIRL